MNQELEKFVEKLRDHSKGCEEKCLDFQGLQFEAKEGEMRLFSPYRSYFFKSDPEKPKSPKVVHAVKQFCTFMKVPYSFFAKNPEYMKNSLVSCWLPTLTADKAPVLAKLRKTVTGDNYIIRALLPVEYSSISNADILSIVSEALCDDFKVEFVIGDERDDLVFHIRLVSKEVFEIDGEECTTGFSVIMSELGAAPISVDTMLVRTASKTAMVASYGGESFFKMEYKGIQPKDLKELFPKVVIHLRDQLSDLKDKIIAAKELCEKQDIDNLLSVLRFNRGLNTKFHTLLAQELEKNPATNRWGFVNRMATIAKEFDSSLRIRIEKVAGELIGLTFEKF